MEKPPGFDPVDFTNEWMALRNWSLNIFEFVYALSQGSIG